MRRLGVLILQVQAVLWSQVVSWYPADVQEVIQMLSHEPVGVF